MSKENLGIKIVFLLTGVLGGIIISFGLLYGIGSIGKQNAVESEEEEISLSVWGEEFEISCDIPVQYIECSRLTTEFSIPIVFKKDEKWSTYIHGEKVESDNIEYKVERINPFANIEVVFSDAGGNSITVYIRTQPSEYPLIETYSDGNAEGVYYFTANGYLTKLNHKGEIIFYQKEIMQTGADTDVIDFKQVKNSVGEKRYCYTQRSTTGNYSTYQAYEYVILDSEYNEIDRIEFMHESENIDVEIMHDNHDFVYIDDGHYIESAYVNKRVYNIPADVGMYEYGSNIQAVVIQEVKNEEVIWSWDSTDYPELYAISVNDLTADADRYANYTDNWSDYAHLNSMEIDPKDGNLVCSFRHFDAIIEINRNDGNIEWILGGIGDQYGLTEEQKFSHQHAAHFTEEGTIIFFDNANAGGYSKVIEVELDEENKLLKKYNAYVIEQQKSNWMGNAQRISLSPNIILVGWGGRGGSMRNTLLLSEVDIDNKKILFEVFCNVDNYRVYKFAD